MTAVFSLIPHEKRLNFMRIPKLAHILGFSGLISGSNWIKLGLEVCQGIMPGLLGTNTFQLAFY